MLCGGDVKVLTAEGRAEPQPGPAGLRIALISRVCMMQKQCTIACNQDICKHSKSALH